MKKSILLILFPAIAFCQAGRVGINTTTPTKTLDVNGEARVQNLPAATGNYSLVVADQDGNLMKAPISTLAQGTCPSFLKSQSNGYYLLFSSPGSIQNPNNPVSAAGLPFVSAGTWIQSNTYYYSYSGTSGNPLNINSFTIVFGNQSCNY